jgi:hypothetical protein
MIFDISFIEKKHQTTFDFSSLYRKQHNDYEFSNAESKKHLQVLEKIRHA